MRLVRKYRDADDFHVAVWSRSALCGLAIGTPSKRQTILRVQYVEGAPWPHPLKGYVLPVTLATAAAYGTALGARVLRLVEPDPSLQRRYQERYGFGPVVYRKGTTYSDLNLEPEEEP